MVPDQSQPPKDGVIFVKSNDGSPPDPAFERIMCYTFGDDPTEKKTITIIIHLLGLARAGWLAAPDKRA
jgi:hypothetical protein